ncbi:DnaB-like helicase C-terminal domain-containing protein [Dactylosporangium sp. McL0621]|uniref:DnaB-like helicase C-terminal domain-containing protein n=1 Tax=Dactylosporangium sp. McL0621 TaxID=3415678 RepID=UPI003CF78597
MSSALALDWATGLYLGVFGLGAGIAEAGGPGLLIWLCITWGQPGWYVVGTLFLITASSSPLPSGSPTPRGSLRPNPSWPFDKRQAQRPKSVVSTRLVLATVDKIGHVTLNGRRTRTGKGTMRFLDRNTTPDDTPIRWLQTHLADAVELRAFVGFFDRAGGGLVEQELAAVLNRGGRVDVVVNRNQDGLPRYPDAVWLLNLLAPHGDRASMRLVVDGAELNSKVYLARDADGVRHALVGSANFTAAGLTRNFESCLALDPDDAALLDAVEAATDAWLKHPAAALVDLGTAHLMRLEGGNQPGNSEVLAAAFTPWLNQLEAMAGALPAVDDDAEVPAPVPKHPCIPSGFSDLDRLLDGGWRVGNLVVVAGRASIGKSILGLDFSRAAAVKHNIPTLIMSFATSKTDLLNRVMAAEARVPTTVLRTANLSDADWTKLARRMGEVSEAPLIINDACTPTLTNVSREIRRAAVELAVELVVIDPVQVLTAGQPAAQRFHELAEISRHLKLLAMELGIVIVALCQVDAPTAGRGPVQHELRGPYASLEHDADVVIFLHRDDFYDRESPRAGEADIIVTKQREGPRDIITVAAQLHLGRFVDMAI